MRWAVAGVLLGAVGCGSTDDGGVEGEPGEDAQLEITGTYVDDFMGTHQVTDELWTQGDYVFHIQSFDNEADYLIAQNDAGNEYNPELWSRFDWHEEASQLYYCQSAFDAPSAAEAEGASANTGDLMAGCGDFAWSTLSTD